MRARAAATHEAEDLVGEERQVRVEDRQLPTYEAALARTGLEAGWRVLDVGCGAGSFLRLVAARGGIGYGVDASDALVSFARSRLQDADVRVGEMEQLPWDGGTFDLVTGFNAFFFANDMVAALREAGRVAKPGAPVVIQVWGAHERCDLEAMKQVARPFLPSGRRTLRRIRICRDPACCAGSPSQRGSRPWTNST